MTWIPETFIRALCWTLLHSLWQGLILAVVAGIVMVVTKRARSATRYTALSLLVLAFLAVSTCTFIRESIAITPGVHALSQSPAISAATPMAGPGAETAPAQGMTVIGQLAQYFNRHASAVVVVWFIVFLARFVNLLSGLVYAQRIRHYQTNPVGEEWQERMATLLKRLRITAPVELLESALVKVPAVVGWLKPAILVPVGMLAQLPPGQVESILLHELAHITRRDYLFNLLQHLMDTLFFFNPALLWVSSLIRQERENCCDDLAIREMRSRRKLVQALVSFHEYQQSSRTYALGFAGQQNSLLKRVERIVHKKNHSLNAGERALLMGGIMLLCGAFITINGTARVAGTAANKHVISAAATKPGMPGKSAAATTGRGGTATMAAKPAARSMAVVRIRSVLDTTPAGAGNSPAGTMTRADVDLIIRAREHGVSTEFLSELKNMGYTDTLEQAIRLKDHGVSIDFLQGLDKNGYGHIPLEQAVRLVDHGVSISFIQRVRASGFPDLTLDQAVTLVDHGVSSDFIEKWRKKTGSKLELRDYIRLQDAGVQPD